jgi:hypothetical protein
MGPGDSKLLFGITTENEGKEIVKEDSKRREKARKALS